MRHNQQTPNGTGTASEQIANENDMGEKDRGDFLSEIADALDVEASEVKNAFTDVSQSTLQALAVELGLPGGGNPEDTTANIAEEMGITSSVLTGSQESDLEANSDSVTVPTSVLSDSDTSEIDPGTGQETREEVAEDIVANSAEYDTVDETLEDYPTMEALYTKRDVLASQGSPMPPSANASSKVDISPSGDDDIEVSSGLLGGGDE